MLRNYIICTGMFLLFSFPNFCRAESCKNAPQIAVKPESVSDREFICNSAEKTLTLLKRYSLAPERQIVVEIIDHGINHLGYMAFGSYDVKSDKIKLMSYESIFARYEKPTMYDEAFDRDHYAGAIAHEITHAVFHHHSTAEAPGPTQQEYLAHAIQLSSLPDEKRKRVLANLNEAAWESGDTLSDIYMALEPGKFAVKSYKHLTTTDNPIGFISILLNSKWFYVDIP